MRGFYLSSLYDFYSFALADNSCLTYVHLSVFIYFKMYSYCVTWSRASHESTGINMFIPLFSLFKNTKNISNVNTCLSTSFKALMHKLLFFYLLQKHPSLNPAQTWFTPIKGTSGLIKVSLLKYFIWPWLLSAMAQVFILL